MLSKKFKSNKFYEVTRYWFKYGNEDDALENTVTVWDSFEKSEQADETAVEEKSEPVNEVDKDEKRVSIKQILPNIYYGVYLDNIPMFYCKSLDEAKKARNFLLKDVRKHKSRDKPP